MRFIISISLLLFGMTFSCKKNENCNNGEVVRFFKRHLETVEDQVPGQAIDGESYLSLFFLESVTDINGSASYGDISYYEKQDSINKDLMRWKNWLQANKCRLSLDSLMKAERQVKEVNPWIQLEGN